MRPVRQNEAPGASATLAGFVADAAWADVASQSHEAKRSILNYFATALGSAYDPAMTSALRVVSPFSGAATSAIIGRQDRLDALGAALVNAISANLVDFWIRSSIPPRPSLHRYWRLPKRRQCPAATR
jgi:2-methylcitrate dehydratase PrpD